MKIKRGSYIVLGIIILIVLIGCFIYINRKENASVDGKGAGNIGGEKENAEEGENENSAEGGVCDADSDCAPNGCCHPAECVEKAKAPNCGRVFCTEECQEGTLDCGQGSCKCVDKKCSAVIDNG